MAVQEYTNIWRVFAWPGWPGDSSTPENKATYVKDARGKNYVAIGSFEEGKESEEGYDLDRFKAIKKDHIILLYESHSQVYVSRAMGQGDGKICYPFPRKLTDGGTHNEWHIDVEWRPFGKRKFDKVELYKKGGLSNYQIVASVSREHLKLVENKRLRRFLEREVTEATMRHQTDDQTSDDEESEDEEALRRDPGVEKRAMEVAMEFERKRKPKDVSNVKPPKGYDIESTGNGERRFIEVKGRSKIGAVILTPKEWKNANWLYVVWNCSSPKPELNRIPNPAKQCADAEKIICRKITAEMIKREKKRVEK